MQHARVGSLGVCFKMLTRRRRRKTPFYVCLDPAQARAGSPAQRRSPRRRPATGELRHTPGRRRRRSPKFFVRNASCSFHLGPPLMQAAPPGPKTRVFVEISILGPLRRPNGHGDIVPKCLVLALCTRPPHTGSHQDQVHAACEPQPLFAKVDHI